MYLLIAHIMIVTACMVRILLRRHRQPESRMAWLVVVLTLPYVGAIAYLLLGETSIGRRRGTRWREIFHQLPQPADAAGYETLKHSPDASGRFMSLFSVGESISGYKPAGANQARLMTDSNSTIDAMVADIDAATGHVHLVFYIWLTDNNGLKLVEALKRAAARGVTCRAMVDDLGSRDMIRSQQWQDMAAAGVHTARALKIGNPLVRIFRGRVDLRNHRKILVIDNRITYCGSQNCADPAFLPKARFAPWVDAVMRFEGPVVRQNQHLFISDWMANTDEDISEILRQPLEAVKPGFTAQVIGTGPTVRNSAMPEMFVSVMYAARRELFVTTPYYVPNSSIQAALCAAANRGVDTSIILPARNDDFAVGATSKSYYEELLAAGVNIYEYRHGILHTKSMTVDGEITLIGSANMDRRSFDLNYENNILLHDPAMTAEMRARQEQYRGDSRPVTRTEVESWSWQKRIWNNAIAIAGPVL